MNELSWLLFWADVAPQLSNAICLASFIMFFLLGLMYILGVTDCFGDAHYNAEDKPTNGDAKFAVAARKLWWLLFALPVLWALTFAVPSDPKTYYAIAASEVGEDLLKTPEIGKARKALNNWLDEQLSDTPVSAPAPAAEE